MRRNVRRGAPDDGNNIGTAKMLMMVMAMMAMMAMRTTTGPGIKCYIDSISICCGKYIVTFEDGPHFLSIERATNLIF